jgi:glyoxylase-like metal-dependent hydrolase (beta-lactamase superfamily II)
MIWNVGQVKIIKILEYAGGGAGVTALLPFAVPEEIAKMAWLLPHYANADSTLKLNVQSWLVVTPTLKIVVDTAVGNDKLNRSRPNWNNRQGTFLKDLESAGYPPESIDLVICTHLHVDHVGWNTRLQRGQWVPTFPNARYVFGNNEYEYWKANSEHGEEKATFEDSIEPIVFAGLADLVGVDHRPCDEISFISTPGHTLGHMSLLVTSGGEQAVLAGDVAHNPCQMAHLHWSSIIDYDPVQSAKTRRELFSSFADTPALIFGGHFDPGRIVRDGDAFKMVV